MIGETTRNDVARPAETLSVVDAVNGCESGVECSGDQTVLHDARHTCGTLMHLEHNVPVAIISAWLGHADTASTMRTYVHNQPETLALAAESISSWTRRTKSAQ